MVFFCSETLLYTTVVLDVLILSFKTFSKSQHKVEETKWAHPRVAGPDVASCWITGVPVTLTLWYSNGTGNHCHKYWLLFSKVRDDAHRVWQIDKILCHQLLFEQKSCGYHIVTWCCQKARASQLLLKWDSNCMFVSRLSMMMSMMILNQSTQLESTIVSKWSFMMH